MLSKCYKQKALTILLVFFYALECVVVVSSNARYRCVFYLFLKNGYYLAK